MGRGGAASAQPDSRACCSSSRPTTLTRARTLPVLPTSPHASRAQNFKGLKKANGYPFDPSRRPLIEFRGNTAHSTGFQWEFGSGVSACMCGEVGKGRGGCWSGFAGAGLCLARLARC